MNMHMKRDFELSRVSPIDAGFLTVEPQHTLSLGDILRRQCPGIGLVLARGVIPRSMHEDCKWNRLAARRHQQATCKRYAIAFETGLDHLHVGPGE